jgi:hypothetical protein
VEGRRSEFEPKPKYNSNNDRPRKYTIMLASIKTYRMSRVPMQAWHTDGRPSNIQVRKASEQKSTSEQQCIKRGQVASEQK